MQSQIFQPVFKAGLALAENPEDEIEVTLNLKSIAKRSQSYYTYQGSLTTPGCNEIVTWMVLDRPLKISEKQVCISYQPLHLNSQYFF